MRRVWGILICEAAAILAGVTVLAAVNPQGTAAQLVMWEAKPGMAKEMEEGYKRHLDWHRRNDDWWAWEGWSITSGDRFGYFVDGTFFHTWKDLDHRVAPADDASDNAKNVAPYGSIRSLSIYDELLPLSSLSVDQLRLPRMTFLYVDVAPGSGRDFERLLGKALGKEGPAHAVFRSATDASRYLVTLPSEHSSDIGAQEELISRLLQTTAQASDGRQLVEHVQQETAQRRPELSYAPERQVH